jgi:uncharacterized protein (DUF1800 family)
MTEKLTSLPPVDAWQTLPASLWDESAARHLLQRVGFSATPPELARVLQDGPVTTLHRYFARMPDFPRPTQVAELAAESPRMARRLTQGAPDEKRQAQKEARERSRDALLDMTIKWLQLASRRENSAAEKWLLFLSDVWVVSIEKVKNAALIYQHQDILRRRALGSAVDLAKAMSRSPAMVVYLDLQQSKLDAPNENFARELFELFTLGEGNYTENDIKQAARAFTGYRQVQGEFIFARRQHDEGRKTVFGQTGNYDGDDIMDLIFRQKASSSFLPKEMVRFYLSDSPLPPAYTDSLGNIWARNGHDLRQLAVTFFSSRAFYAEEYRGGFIKSPVQFYLGLLQNLDLNVAPIPRQVLGPLRQMGQLPFDPPNVRGWIGGRAWINSATLAARRQLTDALLHPINAAALNADDTMALNNAASSGVTHFTLDEARVQAWAKLPPAEAATQLIACTLPGQSDDSLHARITAFLAQGGGNPEATLRTALSALLDSPDYQLC